MKLGIICYTPDVETLIARAILILVIVVVDEVEVRDSISRAREAIRSRSADIIILSVIVIIVRHVLRFVFYPYVGHMFTALFDIPLGLAFLRARALY